MENITITRDDDKISVVPVGVPRHVATKVAMCIIRWLASGTTSIVRHYIERLELHISAFLTGVVLPIVTVDATILLMLLTALVKCLVAMSRVGGACVGIVTRVG